MSTVLYKRVIDEILDKVRVGEIKVGDKLPPETEYAEALGVSRSTLRLAFSHLEKSGVLQRRKRGGTQVIAAKPSLQFNMVTNGIHDVLSLARDTEMLVTSIRTVSGEGVLPLEGLASSTGDWLEITGTRTLEDQTVPFNWSRVYVNGEYAEIRHSLEKRVRSVYQVIEDVCQVSVARVQQDVRAIACPAEVAALIGIAEHAPALMIDARLEDGAGKLVEVSSAIFDPSRFHVSSDVRVSPAA